jgi:hypothetical protein
MRKLHRDRLLQVARVLRELPKGKRVDMGTWKECDSVACAIGWAAQHPWFTRRGFRLDEDDDPVNKNGDICSMATMQFFGLSGQEDYRLFWPSQYENPTLDIRRRVIKRIEKFVEDAA